ncbi:DUF3667 domain-containing protein [uncultured Psychroserpens sp.]|uniref:DUF3667 domain-containing protein n=1 Tax=uncultured Psychroserpens sp. TaxID=255436 RepID=UPI002622C047|nr:DUF3667 domain-containing protein [uncultured Psychroserpens sp.]
MNCKNCKTSLNSEQHYCFECGAKVIKNRLTVKNLSADFSEQFLSYDNKFFSTFIDLFKKPEAVIDGYINGTRKKYINVVQYLAISITLLGIQYFIINAINPGYFIPEPSEFDKLMTKYYPKEALEIFTSFSRSMNEYLGLIYIIGLPASALISWVVFLNERVHNFTEHIVINMYVTDQYIISSAILYLIAFALGIDVTVLIIVVTSLYVLYFAFVFYRLYKLSVLALIIRFVFSMVLFLAVTMILSILTGLLLFLYLKFLK